MVIKNLLSLTCFLFLCCKPNRLAGFFEMKEDEGA